MRSAAGWRGRVGKFFLPGASGTVLADRTSEVPNFSGPPILAATHWLPTDYQGSVKYVIDGSGLSAPITYDSFGNVTGGTTPHAAGSLFGYTGQFFDVETGLGV